MDSVFLKRSRPSLAPPQAKGSISPIFYLLAYRKVYNAQEPTDLHITRYYHSYLNIERGWVGSVLLYSGSGCALQSPSFLGLEGVGW